MYYLLYSSYATSEFDDLKLKELLIQSREKNKRLGITGMLYFFEGKFIQLIEGEEKEVLQLGKTISTDPRHEHFMILKEGPIANRFFKEWDMGFKSLDPQIFENVKNFKELGDTEKANKESVMYLLEILATNI